MLLTFSLAITSRKVCASSWQTTLPYRVRLQVYTLAGLEDMLKKGYRSVTEGKFNDALSRFNAILHIIPLLVVETRREVDDVKELLGIAKCAP